MTVAPPAPPPLPPPPPPPSLSHASAQRVSSAPPPAPPLPPTTLLKPERARARDHVSITQVPVKPGAHFPLAVTPAPPSSETSSLRLSWKQRDSLSLRAPLPQRLPNPPALRTARGARLHARDALQRLVIVAQALTPPCESTPPPPSRAATQQTALEWVAGRLDALADSLGAPATAPQGPAPWPALPDSLRKQQPEPIASETQATETQSQKTSPVASAMHAQPQAQAQTHSAVMGSVAERARQIETLTAERSPVGVKRQLTVVGSVKERALQIEKLLADPEHLHENKIETNSLEDTHIDVVREVKSASEDDVSDFEDANRSEGKAIPNGTMRSASVDAHSPIEPIVYTLSEFVQPTEFLEIAESIHNAPQGSLTTTTNSHVHPSPIKLAPPSPGSDDIPGPARIIPGTPRVVSQVDNDDDSTLGMPFLRIALPNTEPDNQVLSPAPLPVASPMELDPVSSGGHPFSEPTSTLPPNHRHAPTPKAFDNFISHAYGLNPQSQHLASSSGRSIESPPIPSIETPDVSTAKTLPVAGFMSPPVGSNLLRSKAPSLPGQDSTPLVVTSPRPRDAAYAPIQAGNSVVSNSSMTQANVWSSNTPPAIAFQNASGSLRSSGISPNGRSSRATPVLSEHTSPPHLVSPSERSIMSPPPAVHLPLKPVLMTPPAPTQMAPPPSLGIRIPSAGSSLGSPDPPLPSLPSGLDLRLDSFRSRDNSTATNMERNSSYQSRGSTGRAQLRADYDKIYNRPEGIEPPASESQIKIAAGELFVDGAVRERWKFGDKIGEGGFSVVVRARRREHPSYENGTELPKVVAIKIITKKPEAFNRRMVEREVFSYRLMEMVGGHENIVKLFEVSEDMENVYLIMELLEGGELFTSIAEKGQYTEHDAANLVVSMLAALCFCHRFNLKHRDVKPENFVFLKAGGAIRDAELKLTDFGIAHYSEDPEAVCRTMCGTPLYIAPEVLFRQPYGAEADLWSLGVIVFIMLVGYPPFHDSDMVHLVKKIKYKPVSFEGPQWNLISREGKDFLENLLDKDRSNRMTARQALEHAWLVNNCQAASRNVLEVAQANIKSFTARNDWQSAEFPLTPVNKVQRPLALPNGAAVSEHSGYGGDIGNFTVATEDTDHSVEPDGSLWARLRRDRPLQSRRPRSRISSRLSASRDRAARIDTVGEGIPRRSSDGVTLPGNVTWQPGYHRIRMDPHTTSSVSSADPSPSHNRHVALGVGTPEQRGKQRGALWKRRERSEVSEPATHPAAVRSHQSDHFIHSNHGGGRHMDRDGNSNRMGKKDRSRFRFFRS